MLRRTLWLLGVSLVLASPSSSRAQGVVPGGWAPQFGYQVFAGPGAVGFGASASFGYGYGYPGFGGMTAFGPVSATIPNGMMGANPGVFVPPVAETANGVNPLVNSIRHATKKRRSR